jgi:hypothetical protein
VKFEFDLKYSLRVVLTWSKSRLEKFANGILPGWLQNEF